MPRKAKVITTDDKTRGVLEKWSRGLKCEKRLVVRAKIVIACLDGVHICTTASKNQTSHRIVCKWRDRFAVLGLAGLFDAPRKGAPVNYDMQWQLNVLAKLDEPPPSGMARWDGPTLAHELQTSKQAVQRFLQKQGIQLARVRTWCVSTDPEFAAKSADVIGLYLAPPENAIVISVDEKPNIQALSRTTGVVKTRDKKVVSAIKSTYRRNGTLNLFAALVIATGIIYGKTTATKKRPEFLAFMDDVLKEYPQNETTEFHVILDNYSVHKHCDQWLAAHPNVHFHYTPTNASWLNQIEIWFNIMTRKTLRGASHDSKEQLSNAIKDYIEYYNETARPFVWTKREVCGSQIRDKLSNLRV